MIPSTIVLDFSSVGTIVLAVLAANAAFFGLRKVIALLNRS
jgi:hypothetical protein